jgi:hypothetical protein
VRKSTLFLTLTSLNLLFGALLVLHAGLSRAGAGALRASSRDLVRRLQLTDLCLFTEARYTRHPTMADHHAPFQDHPMALEHFPTGSLVTPPLFQREAP